MKLFSNSFLAEYILKESNTTVIVINCTPILETSDIIAELKRVSNDIFLLNCLSYCK